MARFRKNDFFKWAQKIKSVFCFNPYTHEGCDWADARISDMVKEFQSTHPRRVWREVMDCVVLTGSFNPHTHEGCDFAATSPSLTIACFNPHTHEGCDMVVNAVFRRSTCFNPHTHEGCDIFLSKSLLARASFNPHTHEGCDLCQI